MTIMTDKDTVKTLKELANLPTEASEEDLLKIIAYIKELDEVDTTNVHPTYQVGEMNSPLREDVVVENPLQEKLIEDVLTAAPKTNDRYFVVPAIIDKHGE
jgi:aspartyl-tRNA(Asn)/glutamyl-tRNA(Gln) amidotransferase subunit C